MVGSGPKDASSRDWILRQHDRPVVVRREHDRLTPADVLAVDRSHGVSHCRQLRANQAEQLRLERQRVGDLRVAETCHVTGRLDVRAEVQRLQPQFR